MSTYAANVGTAGAAVLATFPSPQDYKEPVVSSKPAQASPASPEQSEQLNQIKMMEMEMQMLQLKLKLASLEKENLLLKQKEQAALKEPATPVHVHVSQTNVNGGGSEGDKELTELSKKLKIEQLAEIEREKAKAAQIADLKTQMSQAMKMVEQKNADLKRIHLEIAAVDQEIIPHQNEANQVKHVLDKMPKMNPKDPRVASRWEYTSAGLQIVNGRITALINKKQVLQKEMESVEVKKRQFEAHIIELQIKLKN
jgi:hypothetical protein